MCVSHNVEGDELDKLRFVLAKDAVLKNGNHAVCEHVASLIGTENLALVLGEEDDTLAEVGEKLVKQKTVF